ncbi:restriction endonuclease subunit S [Proteus penneri]|uniref:Type I restriction modification DNA specificity domain protein n=1 Tax=Proteus penneri TaxID=102862 RepID=A0A0G4QE07_9GAMM|nr:restriction endonuclease subunit S [Proteus penneri]CRL64108.1 Type I restriction modification DNA specificity domain protein [Proteus penneri]
MSADKKVPEIRFKGFSGEWDCLILGENANFTKGQGYSKGDLVTNGVPIILYGRLYTRYQTVITAVDTFVTEKDKSVKSIGGEVIVPASGESPEDISRASVVSEPNIILGGDLNIVLPNKKVNPTFLALAMSMGRLKKILSSKAQGKSVVHIRNSDLADLDIILPSEKPEQTTIGNYFQKLDNLINQHQQKHDKLNNIKKAMLEKMFPKLGETVPEIRFKGFSGEWLNNSIGEICGSTFGGGTPSTSEKSFWQGNIPWIQSSDIADGDVSSVNAKKYITKVAINKSATKLISGNSIAIVTRVGVGKLSLMKDKFATSQDFLSLSDLKVDAQFSAYTIWKQLQIEKEQVQGTSIKGITKEELLSKIITFPKSKLEQIAIGNYFQKLDELINQHQQQITKLNHIKQACLSKMFI